MRHITICCLWCILCFSLLFCACSAEPPALYSSGDHVSYISTVRPASSDAVTSSFRVRKTGALEFFFDNTAGTDAVTLTLHKKGLFRWSDPRDMEAYSDITLPAGETASIQLEKGALSAGEYRFEGSQPDGRALYVISIQEAVENG